MEGLKSMELYSNQNIFNNLHLHLKQFLEYALSVYLIVIVWLKVN